MKWLLPFLLFCFSTPSWAEAGEDPITFKLVIHDAEGDRPLPEKEGRPQAHIAQPLILTLEAEAPRQATLFPPRSPALDSFKVLERLEGQETLAGDTKTLRWRWRILPLRLGTKKLPSMEIPYRLEDGTEGSLDTPTRALHIAGLFSNEDQAQLGSSPPPVPVITTDWLTIWLLSLLGALLLGTLFAWLATRALRHRFALIRNQAPPRPANEVALERLDALDAASPESLPDEERFAQAIDIMRAYLSGRYRIDAMEMTTAELRTILPTLDLRGQEPTKIEALLWEADMVKFAKHAAASEQARSLSARIRALIEDTWVPPEPVARARRVSPPANRQQRAAIALFDGATALVLTAALITPLSLAVHLPISSLAWIATLSLSLYALLRDSLGLSLGKRLMRVQLVTAGPEQAPPTQKQRLTRNLLLFFWPLTLPLELFMIWTHPHALRLGDLQSETRVVRHEQEAES